MKKPSPVSSNKKTKLKAAHTKKAKANAAGQVRIIGGQLKRRNVRFIDGEGLRPTPDRLRETLFNWLLADIHGARVLDSCAGSGVLGFEALSRGAAHCTFIEANPAQVKTLAQNAEQLRLDTDSFVIIAGEAQKVLTQNHNYDQAFDIVFIDPPYADDLWQPILRSLINQALISTQTLIYLEADKDLSTQLAALAKSLSDASNHSELATLTDFICLKQSKVGQVVAGLYRLSSS